LLEAHGYPPTIQAAKYAAEKGHLEVLMWMHDCGLSMGWSVVKCAILGQEIRVIEWLRSVVAVSDERIVEASI
jgi:hypothetical protein